MKRFIVLAAAAAIAFAATPAVAKSKKKYRAPQPYYGETYYGPVGTGPGLRRRSRSAAGQAAMIRRSVTRQRPDFLAPAAGASKTSATAASSTAVGEPVGRSTSLRGACSLRITSGDPAALSPYLLRAGRLPSNRHPALVILPDQARERFLRDMSMRAAGAGISARCVAPQPRHSSVHTWRRLSRRCGSIRTMRVAPPHCSQRGPARIFGSWACAGHARENAASRRRGG